MSSPIGEAIEHRENADLKQLRWGAEGTPGAAPRGAGSSTDCGAALPMELW